MKPLFAVAGIIALLAGSAYAQDRCEPFTYHASSEHRERTLMDHGEPGVSVGDVRHSIGPLFDEADNRIGQSFVQQTVVIASDEDEVWTRWDATHQFSAGSIFSVREPLPLSTGDAVDNLSTPNFASGQNPTIIGGTGVFAGATGTIVMERTENGSVGQVNVSCR